MNEKIYCYHEHCTMKGHVFRGDSEEAEATDDCFLWGEGTRDELIEQAVDRLSQRFHDKGSAGDHFAWTCCRSVLQYLDGPDVEFDESTFAWKVVSPDVEDEE